MNKSEPPTTDFSRMDWPFLKRFTFRFLAVYFVLFTFPFPFNYIPKINEIVVPAVATAKQKVAVSVGKTVFGVEEMFLGQTGSGDTTQNYVFVFSCAVVSLLVAIIWSIVSRKTRRYRKLRNWLVIACSYYLGVVMLTYGLAKVIPTQFQLPGLHRLMSTYGESSPMGLLWTFMGASPAYTIFAGLCEMLGGSLLLFRKTQTLGALVIIGVMTNVVMLNFCYDVPVKLYSLHYLVMAALLASLDLDRLISILFLNRATEPREPIRFFVPAAFDASRDQRLRRLSMNYLAQTIGLVLVGYIVVNGLSTSYDYYRSSGDGREKSAYWGIYDVTSFQVDGEELPMALNQTRRWKTLIIDRPGPMKFGEFVSPGLIGIQQMNGTILQRTVNFDEETGKLELTVPPNINSAIAKMYPVGELRLERQDNDSLLITGELAEQSVKIRAVRRSTQQLPLISREFNWISELPYNR